MSSGVQYFEPPHHSAIASLHLNFNFLREIFTIVFVLSSIQQIEHILKELSSIVNFKLYVTAKETMILYHPLVSL